MSAHKVYLVVVNSSIATGARLSCRCLAVVALGFPKPKVQP